MTPTIEQKAAAWDWLYRAMQMPDEGDEEVCDKVGQLMDNQLEIIISRPPEPIKPGYQPPGTWVSVKDKYPEHGQVVAFIVDPTNDYYGVSVCAGRFKWFDYGDFKAPEFSTWGLTTTASYWMPLPATPEELAAMGGD